MNRTTPRGRGTATAVVAGMVVALVGGASRPAGAAIDVFFSTSGITIDDAAADPYPSSVTVSGTCGVTTDVDVAFQVFSHEFPLDIDILLVGPGGRNAIIMSDAGGTDLVDAEITLDDQAAAPLPESTMITNGSYRPANYGAGDPFSAPAPPPSGGSALSVFNGINPNGTWDLFVMDDTPSESGAIDAWGLQITSSRTSEICIPGGASSSGPAAPYPDMTTVSGLSGPITDVNLTITDLSHRFPSDMDVLLVGPGGHNAVVMADAGLDFEVSGLSLTLDDEATSPLPSSTELVDGNVYRPGNLSDGIGLDSWGAPAPTPSGGSALSVFDGTNPNGTWSLFIQDDQQFFAGRIDDWSLQISHAGFDPSLSLGGGKVREGKKVIFSVDLSAAPIIPFDVPFATVSGSAKAGKDFKTSSGSLTFAPGETSRSVTVKTKDDRKDEKNKEKFSLRVTSGGTSFEGQATIKDNDR